MHETALRQTETEEHESLVPILNTNPKSAALMTARLVRNAVFKHGLLFHAFSFLPFVRCVQIAFAFRRSTFVVMQESL